MKFQLGELENLFYDIKEIIKLFEELQYDQRRVLIFLSNGDRISYRVTKGSIPHLLGININYLRSTGCFKEASSYEILKQLVDNAYRIHNLANDGIINYNSLFSPFIKNKVASFENNIKTNIFYTEFVCKFDSKKTFGVTEKFQKCDYIIVKKNNTTNMYEVLTLVKSVDDNNNEYYLPMSNQTFADFESFKAEFGEIITNQEITMINGTINTNITGTYNQKYILPVDIKKEKFSKLIGYKEQLNCSIDVNSDFEFSLEETMKHMDNHYDDNEVIDYIIECVKTGSLIDLEKYKIGNKKLLGIVQAYNDRLCGESNSVDSEVGLTYTAMKQKLKELEEIVLSLQIQNSNLTEENNKLKNQNSLLTQENNGYQDTNQKILELLNSKPSK